MTDIPPRPARYSDEEVKAILERALAPDEQEFSRDDLVAMAAGLEISDAQLARAESMHSKDLRAARMKEFIAGRRKKALREGGAYLALCLVLYLFLQVAVIAVISGMFVMPLVFLGMFLLVNVIDALFRTSGPDLEREFDYWFRKQDESL